MKLGISSFAFSWSIGVPGSPPPAPLDAFGLLDHAARLGVRVVQFGDNLPLHRLEARERARLAARAESQGISIEVGTRGLVDDNVAAYLAIARELRSPILRIVIDLGAFRPDEAEVRAALLRLVPRLEAAGIVLAIENHDRFRAHALASMVRSAGSPFVRVCLDTVNSFGALEGPELVVEALGPLTASLHVKDFAVERVWHNMGFTVEGAPAGSGRLDLPWLLKRLGECGVDPNAILELWVSPGASIEQTVATEQAWVEQSVRYLRTLIPG